MEDKFIITTNSMVIKHLKELNYKLISRTGNTHIFLNNKEITTNNKMFFSENASFLVFTNILYV